jgi:very-short-patch-repair endonuclease
MKTYNPTLILRAREMRREMTPAEKYLWYNCLRLLPVRFRRQRPVGAFIADFYCPTLKLVLEVDGDSHFSEEGARYDTVRSSFLNGLGLTVLRFTNHEVLHNLPGVDESLRLCIAHRLEKE